MSWQFAAFQLIAPFLDRKPSRPSWAPPLVVIGHRRASGSVHPYGMCINCGIPYSEASPYGGVDEGDGVHMCKACWRAYDAAKV